MPLPFSVFFDEADICCHIYPMLVSTPEAAEELMDSISERVRARQDMVVHGSPLYGPKARTTQHNRLVLF